MERLSDEDIKEILEAFGYEDEELERIFKFSGVQAVAHASHDNCLRQMVEWGDELCLDHNGEQRKEQGWKVRRRECLGCWQELQEEVKK